MPSLHTRSFFRMVRKDWEVYLLQFVTLSIAFAVALVVISFAVKELTVSRNTTSHLTHRVLQKNETKEFEGRNRFTDRIQKNWIDSLEFLRTVPGLADKKILAPSRFSTYGRSKTLNDVNVASQTRTVERLRVHAWDPELAFSHDFDFYTVDFISESSSRRFGIELTNKVLISESLSLQLFGTIESNGMPVSMFTSGDTITHTVGAVFQDVENSHDNFNLILPYDESNLKALNFDPKDFGLLTTLIDDSSRPEIEAEINKLANNPNVTYHLQPLDEIYFGPRVIGETSRHGDIYCIVILLCISGLIILVAATNFVNLTSLTLPARSKEIAIRKVAGAQRPPLLGMLSKESLAITFMSLVVGIILLVATNQFTIVHSTAGYAAIVLLFFVIAAAPLLPAWAFVKASPGRLLGSDTITFPRMKNVITVVQLGVSISLIVASLVIDRQISRSLIKEPGKNHDQVIYLPYPSGLTKGGLARLKTQWPVSNPNILGLTAVSHTPDNLTSKPIGEDYYRLNVDFDFKDFFGLEMADGRWFSANDNDSTVVNEVFTGRDSTKIGVVKNIAGAFNLPDKPVRITVDKDEYNFLMIRVLEVNIRSTLKVVSEFSEEITGRPVTPSFLDKNYETALAYEDRLNKMSSLLAMVSIVMACCAIYALSLSRMRDNLKQIAIRKTFGASDGQIVQRLSWQFLELMLGSLCIFGPLTYFLLREWLRNFAYSARFDWSDPLVSICVCLVIVGITNLFLLGRINKDSLKDLLRR